VTQQIYRNLQATTEISKLQVILPYIVYIWLRQFLTTSDTLSS